MRHVGVLADDTFEGREAGSRGGQAAAGYLDAQFRKLGLLPAGSGRTYHQMFGSGYRNLLGMLEGADPALRQEVIVVGAHYDHVGYGTPSNSYGPLGYIHNGADDNASGVAGLLEIVEGFVQSGVRPRRSIVFALWDGEEKGLLGSKHWLEEPTLPRERVKFFINTDMIGRLREERLEIIGTRSGWGLRSLVSRQNRETNLLLDFSWEMKADSDHQSFYAKQIPVLMLHTGLHGEYHRPSDDIHTLNVPGLQRVTRFMFNVVYALASEEQVTQFRAKSQQESPETQKTVERGLPPLPGRLGVSWDAGDPGPGLRVTHVAPGSAAQQAGVRPSDRLVKFAGRAIVDGNQLRSLVLRGVNPISMTLLRAGSETPLELAINLAGNPVRWGMSWRVDDAEPGTAIVSRIVPSSPADAAGLQVNDRVVALYGEPIGDLQQFQQRIARAAGPLQLLVERSGRLSEVELVVPEEAGD
jgi:hypothetical protein